VLYGLRIAEGYVEMKTFGNVHFIYIALHLVGFAGGAVTSMIHRRRMWLNLILLSALLTIPVLFFYSNIILNYLNRFVFINLILAPLGTITSGLLISRIYTYNQKRDPVVDEPQLT